VTGLVISNVISLIIPLISIRLIDSFHHSEDIKLRWMLLFLLGWILALCVVVILEYVQNILFRKYGNKVIIKIFDSMINTYLNHNYQIWMIMDSRENTERIKRNLEDLLPLVSGAPFVLIRHILVICITIMMLIVINWQLTLVVSLLIPLYCLSFLLYNTDIKSSYWVYRRSGEKFIKNLIEFIQSIPLVKLLGSIPQARNDLDLYYGNVVNTQYRYFKIMIKRRTYFRFLSAIVPVYLVMSGYIFVSLNMASVGEIFGFWGLFSLANASMNGFSAQYTGLLKALTVYERIGQHINPPVKPPLPKVHISRIAKICAQGVSFSYLDARKRDLVIPDFEIRCGEIIQITGASGAGKTTLLKVILGLLPANSGEIIVNEIPRIKIKDTSFFDHIGYVEQNGYLFSRSVRDNVLMGRSFEIGRWNKIAGITGLEHITSKLPQKENSQIGENGFFLSGGQRQKILIARALYHQPEWLFLDEPFTGIDAAGQEEIEDLLRSLQDRLTLILVTHQPRFGLPCTQKIQLSN
jgi:ABC-type bacteriocin/lantibiotic exporter with double-glycine peptidase domain